VTERRQTVLRKLDKSRRPKARQSNRPWREAVMDLARLDIVQWLRGRRSPDGGRATTVADLRVAGSGPSRPPRPGTPDYPTPDAQVREIAQQVVAQTWESVADEVDAAAQDPATVRRELTRHFWCDLLIGLAAAVEDWQGPLERIPAEMKRRVTTAVSRSSHSHLRRHVTAQIITILVDKAWDLFMSALIVHFPVRAVLSNDDLVRSLRILAVFSCPAPGQHREVREQALRPLGDELDGLLEPATQDELRRLFAEWQDEDGAARAAGVGASAGLSPRPAPRRLCDVTTSSRDQVSGSQPSGSGGGAVAVLCTSTGPPAAAASRVVIMTSRTW
jgi:hypothetical protein